MLKNYILNIIMGLMELILVVILQMKSISKMSLKTIMIY